MKDKKSEDFLVFCSGSKVLFKESDRIGRFFLQYLPFDLDEPLDHELFAKRFLTFMLK